MTISTPVRRSDRATQVVIAKAVYLLFSLYFKQRNGKNMTPGPHVLFIDDRLQARALLDAGLDERACTSSWLVLDRRTLPKGSRAYELPAPLRSQYATAEARFAQIAASDPWVRYFGGNADHYRHYYEQIKKRLIEIRPDLVVGGLTHFHELLTVEVCREWAIPYVVPVSAGESSGRFFCYRANTLETVAGSGERPQTNEIADYIAKHAGSSIAPDGHDALRTSFTPLRRRAAITGEPFCLPSLVKRRAMVRRNQGNVYRWNTGSKTVPFPTAPNGKIKILFPLQSQPDPAIDVWGARYSDQAALLQRLATAVGDQATIFVKPRPNAACEINPSLFEVVRRNHALVPLSTRVPMRQALARTDLVITVTDTIALHAILSGKLCATLAPSRNNRVSGCRYLGSPEKLASLLYDLQSTHFPMHGPEELAGFVEEFFAESYEGVISHPYAAEETNSPKNSERLVAAFGHIAAKVAGSSVAPSFGVRPETLSKLQEIKA